MSRLVPLPSHSLSLAGLNRDWPAQICPRQGGCSVGCNICNLGNMAAGQPDASAGEPLPVMVEGGVIASCWPRRRSSVLKNLLETRRTGRKEATRPRLIEAPKALDSSRRPAVSKTGHSTTKPWQLQDCPRRFLGGDISWVPPSFGLLPFTPPLFRAQEASRCFQLRKAALERVGKGA